MRNFSSPCLLPWLLALEYRQLSRFFPPPSCLSTLITFAHKAMMQISICAFLPLLQFYPPLIAPVWSSSTCCGLHKQALRLQEDPRPAHSLVLTDTNQLVQNTHSFSNAWFTLPVGQFQNLSSWLLLYLKGFSSTSIG